MGHVGNRLVAGSPRRPLQEVVLPAVASREGPDVVWPANAVPVEAVAAVLGLVLASVELVVHLPARLVAGAAAIAVQGQLEVGLAALEGETVHLVGGPRSSVVPGPAVRRPIAVAGRPLPTAPEAARSGRCARPSYAVLLPAVVRRATMLVDVGLVPVGQAAIGLVKAVEVRNGRLGDLLQVESSKPKAYLAVGGQIPVTADHVVLNEARLVAQAYEDAQLMEAVIPLVAVVLLHAAKVWPAGAPVRLAFNRRHARIGRRPRPEQYGPGLARLRQVALATRTPAGLEGQAAVLGQLIPATSRPVPVRLTFGRCSLRYASQGFHSEE